MTEYESRKKVELKRLELLEEQKSKLNSEIIEIKRKYQLDIYCCKDSECSNGWHHDSDCKNYVLTF